MRTQTQKGIPRQTHSHTHSLSCLLSRDPQALADDVQTLTEFVNEAALLGALHHPCLTRLDGLYVIETDVQEFPVLQLVLAIELCTGGACVHVYVCVYVYVCVHVCVCVCVCMCVYVWTAQAHAQNSTPPASCHPCRNANGVSCRHRGGRCKHAPPRACAPHA